MATIEEHINISSFLRAKGLHHEICSFCVFFVLSKTLSKVSWVHMNIKCWLCQVLKRQSDHWNLLLIYKWSIERAPLCSWIWACFIETLSLDFTQQESWVISLDIFKAAGTKVSWRRQTKLNYLHIIKTTSELWLKSKTSPLCSVQNGVWIIAGDSSDSRIRTMTKWLCFLTMWLWSLPVGGKHAI